MADLVTLRGLLDDLLRIPERARDVVASGRLDHLDQAAVVRAVLAEMYAAAGRRVEALEVVDALVKRLTVTTEPAERLAEFDRIASALEDQGLARPALPIRRSIVDLAAGHDVAVKVRAASALARCLDSLQAHEDAAREHRRALRLAHDSGEEAHVLLLRVNLAVCLQEQGELRESIELVDQVLSNCTIDPGTKRSALTVRAACRNQMGDFARAEVDARAALALVRQLELGWHEQLSVLSTLGNAVIQRDARDARPIFAETEKLARQERDRRSLCAALHNLAACAIAVDEPATARDYLEEALTIAVEVDDVRAQAVIAGRMAEALRCDKDHASALEWSERQLVLWRRLDHRPGEFLCQVALAETTLRMSMENSANPRRREGAVELGLERALDSVNLAYVLALTGELDESSLAEMRRVADLATHAVVRVDAQTRASGGGTYGGPTDVTVRGVPMLWVLTEATRALAERLVYDRDLRAASVDGNSAEVSRALARVGAARAAAVDARDSLVAGAGSSGRWASAERDLREAEGQLHRLLFGKARSLDADRLDPERVLEDLGALVSDGDTAVVRYQTTGDTVFALIATDQGLGWYDLEINGNALRLFARLLRWSIANAELRVGASALFTQLLMPVLPWVETRDLLIVPDGPLADLPWGALDPTTLQLTDSEDAPWIDGVLDELDRLIAERDAKAMALASGLSDNSQRAIAELARVDTRIFEISKPFRSKNAHAVFDEYAVTVCPSVHTAARLADRARELAGARGLLALVDPEPRLATPDSQIPEIDPLSDARNEARAVLRTPGSVSQRLVYTRREAARAAELLGIGRAANAIRSTCIEPPFAILMGKDATHEGVVSAVSSIDGQGFAAVHFGAHGVVFHPGVSWEPGNSDSGMEHVVPPQVGVLLSDGAVLSAHDLVDLRVRSFVTTLFCCHSRVGSSPRSDLGPASLTSAFHSAGAVHVAACTGTVPDETTATLSDAFYEALSRGVPPAHALRYAQQRVRDERPRDPATWGPFVMSGPPARFGLGDDPRQSWPTQSNAISTRPYSITYS